MKKLIADCGSTKINWCLLDGKDKVAQIFTTGMNALLMTEDEMAARIAQELMPNLQGYHVDEIYYYGAGIINDKIRQQVVNALQRNITTAQSVHVESPAWHASLAPAATAATTTARRWWTTCRRWATSWATKAAEP